MDEEDFEDICSSLESNPKLTEAHTVSSEHASPRCLVEWSSFESGLRELLEARGRLLTSFDLEVARSVYSACSKALADNENDQSLWHSVPAPTGGGKTTASFAFAAALVRSGGSVLFLANTRRECDEAYRSLELLLPGKVAIRTTDHDQAKLDADGSSYVEATKARDDGYQPAAFFHRSQLGNYPALIGTHNGYKQHPRELPDLADGGRRTLILVDERPEDIDVADFSLADFEQIHELCRTRLGLEEGEDEPVLTKAFGEACRQLAQLGFDRSRQYHELRLSLDSGYLEALKRLTEKPRERSRLTAGTEFDPEDLRLAARLIILAQETQGFAFAALHTGYSYGARFVAYAPNWPLRPGTVLLDATSDIDGYAELSDARHQEAVPQADYSQLEAVHLDGPPYATGVSPKELWEKTTTRTPLLNWMQRCILENTQPGESILLVSWKKVIEGGQLQLLDWQERNLHYCHFGAGIGSNQWRHCGAVFVFGSFVKPHRITMAETLGIKEAPFQTNDDATIRELRGDYSITKVGLMLRWFKQLAMRGCARELDEHGVAKPMRLYFSTDQFRLMVDHWNRMFPGAPMPKSSFVNDEDPQANSKPSRRKSVAEDLLKFLSSCEQAEVSSEDIRKATGIILKSDMRGLSKNTDFLARCEALGWKYLPARGRGRQSRFIRVN